MLSGIGLPCGSGLSVRKIKILFLKPLNLCQLEDRAILDDIKRSYSILRMHFLKNIFMILDIIFMFAII